MELLVLLGTVCVVAMNALAPRIGVPAPLLLVVLGVVVSLQRVVPVPVIVLDPRIVLEGVLPPLLFAAAVSMPATNFRRNFGAISGLSVALVVVTSLVLGAVFEAVLPGLGFAGGVAIGAVISPTDAVATAIVKRLGVAPRTVALLDGEALLNDASALVLLRASVAAMAASVSVGSVIGRFAFSIVVATAIGMAIGGIALRVRRQIHETTVNTLLSFTVPFAAYHPAEHLGASGLVAVVAAAMVIGQGAPRFLGPAHRLNERINWHTIEMLLEGGLFLMTALQLPALVGDVQDVASAFALAGGALLITLAARALYAVPLIWSTRPYRRRYAAVRGRLEELQRDLVQTPAARAALAEREVRFVDWVQTRARRLLADADYDSAHPLGLRDGVLLVWAGMRGAITLAAAQTLPPHMPHRSLLVFVAFVVALLSLLVQGGTLPWVVRRLRFPPADTATAERERRALAAEIEAAALACLDEPEARASAPAETLDRLRHRLSRSAHEAADEQRFAAIGALLDRVFEAQRDKLLAARTDGVYSSEALAEALARLDATQIGFQLAQRGRLED